MTPKRLPKPKINENGLLDLQVPGWCPFGVLDHQNGHSGHQLCSAPRAVPRAPPFTFEVRPLTRPLTRAIILEARPLTRPLIFEARPLTRPLIYGARPLTRPLIYGARPLTRPVIFQAPGNLPGNRAP